MITWGWRCTKVLPTVFDDSLSYYEEICKLIKMVEESKVYEHCISMTGSNTNTFAGIGIIVHSNSEAKMDFLGLCNFLSNNGFVDENHVYPISGGVNITDNETVYTTQAVGIYYENNKVNVVYCSTDQTDSIPITPILFNETVI